MITRSKKRALDTGTGAPTGEAPRKKARTKAVASPPTTPPAVSVPSTSATPPTDTALARLDRWEKRTAKRGVYPLPLYMGKDVEEDSTRTTRRDAPTPWGTAGLSTMRFEGKKVDPRTRDPQSTTRQDQFPNTTDPGARYNQVIPSLDLDDVRDLSKAFKERREGKKRKVQPMKDRTQASRNKAMAYTLTQDAEQQRTGGQAKQARSAFNLIANPTPKFLELAGAKTADSIDIFKTFDQAFPVSRGGGKQHPNRLKSGELTMSPLERYVVENASDSSDSDADDPFAISSRTDMDG
jgi:hypothetical protein